VGAKSSTCLGTTFKFGSKGKIKVFGLTTSGYGTTKDFPVVADRGKFSLHCVNNLSYLDSTYKIGENIKQMSSYMKVVNFELVIRRWATSRKVAGSRLR
jgi:hypothetical protein